MFRTIAWHRTTCVAELALPIRKAKCWVKVKNPKAPAMLRIGIGDAAHLRAIAISLRPPGLMTRRAYFHRRRAWSRGAVELSLRQPHNMTRASAGRGGQQREAVE